MRSIYHSALIFATLLLTSLTSAQAGDQSPTPSNDSTQIPPINASPRLWVNSSDFPSLLIFPLSFLAGEQAGPFYNQWGSEWNMTLLNATNGNSLSDKALQIAYISCDPQDYGGNLDALNVLSMSETGNSALARVWILYTSTSDHCNFASSSAGPGSFPGLFTTLNATAAGLVAQSLMNSPKPLGATISPDTNSDGRFGYGNGGGPTPGPTTAVAMIILYTITGLITMLFLIIIITGAIRAHRHPERYGPRNAAAGRPRRSRAKGIARAMLDTIPIVKFGEKEEERTKSIDIEMTTDATKDKSAVITDVQPATNIEETSGAIKPDGTDEEGHLGCAICTEDFNKGEEVRVLPCNHKFHPVCVDPWLLNVSGTCPLCRIDLRPDEAEEPSGGEDQNASSARRSSLLNHEIAPPLGFVSIRLSNRDMDGQDRNVAALRSVANTGSRADRIAALRQLRQQRQTQETATGEGEDRGLSTRLRERFRVLTQRQGEDEDNGRRRQSRLGPPRATWAT